MAGFDAAQEAALLLDPEGRVEYANSAAQEMLAVARQDLHGRSFWSFLVSEKGDATLVPGSS